jgi:hypothetical protein
MPFTIQWTGPLGPATTSRDSPVEAIRFAVELLGNAYGDVLIIDQTQGGKAYTPPEFATFYKDAKG